jgi:hypothetical protein
MYLDNEWAFTMDFRVLCSEQTGKPLNSPEFVRTFNLKAQLAYQALARSLASQGFNAIMPGPFEDLTCDVGGKPLYLKMKEDDFVEFDFSVVQLLMLPLGVDLTADTIVGHPAMADVENEIQRRRVARGSSSEAQRQLDADKAQSDYYQQRAAKVLRTYEMFSDEITLVRYAPGDSPETVASLLAQAIG